MLSSNVVSCMAVNMVGVSDMEQSIGIVRHPLVGHYGLHQNIGCCNGLGQTPDLGNTRPMVYRSATCHAQYV